ncbi:Ferric reduction oxidase 8 [Diplonema papillatum]|nr:Ferric reduction oxidase 8 [Diplonema papillatum]
MTLHLLLLASVAASAAAAGHVSLHAQMDLYWTLEENDTVIKINMTCASTEQYCAFGLGQSMSDADTVLCRVDGTSAVCFDGSVSAYRAPVADDQQDYSVVASEVSSDGTWSVMLMRSVISSDATDKAFIVSGQLQSVIWAHGPYNAAAELPFDYHDAPNRGSISISWKPLVLVNPQHLELAADMHLYWQVMEDETFVAINMTCPSTDQYCAFGLGQSMSDADTVLCRMDGTAAVCFDGSVSAYRAPVADDQQDYSVLSSEVSPDGTWSVMLTRSVISSDATDKAFIVSGQLQSVIWAHGPYNAAAELPFDYHDAPNRGSISISWKPLVLVNPQHLELAADMHLYWQVMEDETVVAINMTCPSAEQYCAFGLGQSMSDADTVLCRVDGTAAVCFDGSVSAYRAPVADDQQDYSVIASEVSSDGTWSVMLMRSVISSDATDKAFIVSGQLQSVIWAHGPYNAAAELPFDYHDAPNRGSISISWKPLVLVNPQHLELAADMHLYWQVMEDETVVAINMTCPSTEQYCAFGLGQSMSDADTVLCRVDGTAAVCFDGSVSAYRAPVADDQQDYSVIASEVSSDGTWSVMLMRSVISSDATDKAFIVSGQLQSVIWAHGPYNAAAELPFDYHDAPNRGSISISWKPLVLVNPQHLELAADMHLYWQVMMDATLMAINMTCPSTEQYCAFGLGQSMSDADTVLCRVDGTAAVCFDGSVSAYRAPVADDQQDYSVIASEVSPDGTWSVMLTRSVISSDATDKAFIVSGQLQSVIWAHGPYDAAAELPFSYHEEPNRGAASIVWGSQQVPATPAPGVSVATPAPGASVHSLTGDFSVSVQLETRDLLDGTRRSSEALATGDFPYTHVLLTFVCRVGQYCALGLSGDGTMLQSDAMVCWEHADGIRCVDWYCTSRAACPEDASQDLVVEGSEVLGDGWYTVKVSRLLDTGDDKDRAITSENIDFIFAHGAASSTSSPSARHAAEGTVAINALTGTAEVSDNRDTAWVHVFVSIFLLIALGLASGILITVRPRLGYALQQSAAGSVLSIVFISASIVTMAVGDYEHYQGRIMEVGALFGGPAQICLALTLLVKVKVFSPCLFLMSVPQERALVWHRWIGRVGWVFVTLHALAVMVEYNQNSDEELMQMELPTGGTTDGADDVHPVSGLVAWVLYTILVLLGLPVFRRSFYQAFIVSHVVLSIGTLACTIFHLPGGWRTWAIFGIPVVLYILDTVYRTYLGMHSSRIQSHTNVGSVTKLIIEPAKPIKEWGPGSYFYVSVPRAGFMEYHPLSVTSHHSTNTATFYAKNMGPGTWTARLTQLPEDAKAPLQAKLEGPYGKLSFDMDKHNKLVLIAGGIGVTPMLSVIRYMDAAQEATLSWSVRDAELVEMLANDLHELAVQFKGLRVIVSFTGVGLDAFKHETDRIIFVRGRPDYEKLLSDNATEHSAVAVCGPSGMVAAASEVVRRSPYKLPLHTETFEF